MNDKSKKIVQDVLDELYNRNGFDDWWGNLDDDIRDEIKEELIKVVESNF